MKKTYLIWMMGAALCLSDPVCCSAETVQGKEVQVLNAEDPDLNAKEWEAAKMADQWIHNDVMPEMDQNGKIIYTYGATLPSVVCAPLKVCDLELQAGEKIKNVNVGDNVRWSVTPALSGPEGFETTHLIIKPKDVGLDTNLIVTTDRRTYHVKLISRKIDYLPRVGFLYPEDIDQQWQQYYARQEQEKAANTIPETRENVEDLQFNYAIDGWARWKPLRVYNNGTKTIIQMPTAMKQTEAPALLVVGAGDEEQIVNYRLKRDRYIVDQIFDKAILIAGVGEYQERVTITRNN